MAKRDSGTRRSNSDTKPKAPSPTAGGATKASNKKPAAVAKKPVATAVRAETRGRSGGVVDAPGKKHRKPMPSDPGASRVDSQAAKLRTAAPMAKTDRRRGRG